MSRIITNEIIDQRVKDLGKNIRRKSDYKNMKEKMDWICDDCNYEWEGDAISIFQNQYCCPSKGTKIAADKNRMTDEKIDKQLIEKGILIKRKTSIENGNSRTRLIWECVDKTKTGEYCGYNWESTICGVLYEDRGCPKCGGNAPLTNESIDKKLIDGKRNILREEDITGKTSKDVMKWRCVKELKDGSVCNYIWETTYACIFGQKSGCHKCVKQARLTNEIIDQRLKDWNISIKRIGDVINCKIKILWKCEKDGYEWDAQPQKIVNINLLERRGCPLCRFSKGNLELDRVCKNLNFKSEAEVRFPDCRDINTLPFDRYLFDFNCCIEVQGKQHYDKKFWKKFGLSDEECQRALEKLQHHDKIKKEYCESKGILLLEINYKDIKNMEFIIKEYLKIK